MKHRDLVFYDVICQIYKTFPFEWSGMQWRVVDLCGTEHDWELVNCVMFSGYVFFAGGLVVYRVDIDGTFERVSTIVGNATVWGMNSNSSPFLQR